MLKKLNEYDGIDDSVPVHLPASCGVSSKADGERRDLRDSLPSEADGERRDLRDSLPSAQSTSTSSCVRDCASVCPYDRVPYPHEATPAQSSVSLHSVAAVSSIQAGSTAVTGSRAVKDV